MNGRNELMNAKNKFEWSVNIVPSGIKKHRTTSLSFPLDGLRKFSSNYCSFFFNWTRSHTDGQTTIQEIRKRSNGQKNHPNFESFALERLCGFSSDGVLLIKDSNIHFSCGIVETSSLTETPIESSQVCYRWWFTINRWKESFRSPSDLFHLGIVESFFGCFPQERNREQQ